jgi:thiol-disulfide isomerase/thioredoxin
MKKSICFFLPVMLSLLGMYSCTPPEEAASHTLSGRLTNAPEKMVYFEGITDSGGIYLDSAETDKEGNFVLANRATSLDYFMFRVDATNAVFLVLQGNENLEINGDAKDLDNTYTISGSKDCELIRELKRYDKLVSDSLFYDFKTQSEAMPERRDSLIKASQLLYTVKMNRYAKQFIDLYPASLVSLSVTRYLDHNSKEDMALMEGLSKSLLSKYPDNIYIQKFAGGLEELKFLPVGSPAPEISMKDTSGRPVKLSSLRGKVVLIDFWASWCVPCRQANPKVVELYRQYKSKGFEIYGVSLDDNKERWTQAIRADKLAWYHVSELKKWDSNSVKEYHISAIPFTVLIDRNGKIIEKGLSVEALEKKLGEIL